MTTSNGEKVFVVPHGESAKIVYGDGTMAFSDVFGSMQAAEKYARNNPADKKHTSKTALKRPDENSTLEKSSRYFLSKDSSSGQAIHDLALEMETEVNPNFKIPKDRMSDFKLLDEIMADLSEDERTQFVYDANDDGEGAALRKKFGKDGKLVYDLLADMFNGENGMKGIMKDQI